MADDELWGSRQGGGLGAGGRALAAGDGAQCSGAWWARCGAGCTGWGGGGGDDKREPTPTLERNYS